MVKALYLSLLLKSFLLLTADSSTLSGSGLKVLQTPTAGRNEEKTDTSPEERSMKVLVIDTSEHNQNLSCKCSSLYEGCGSSAKDDNLRIAFKNLEVKVASVENKILVQVFNVTHQQYGMMASLLNESNSLRFLATQIHESQQRSQKSQQNIDSRVLGLEEQFKHLQEINAFDEENMIKKSEMRTPEVENLKDELFQIKEGLENAASKNVTNYLIAELSTLSSISTQLDELSGKMASIATSKTSGPEQRIIPKDCDDLANMGVITNGVYDLQPYGMSSTMQGYCRFVGNRGWLVLQRRLDGLTTFQRSWYDYAFGFGSLYGDFWLGNHYINILTRQAAYQLKITMTDWENNIVIALYNRFLVEGREEKYRITIGGLASNNSMEDPMSYHNGMRFSTYDEDNDSAQFENCASKYSSGWWFASCLKANLNGRYSRSDGRFRTNQYHDGIVWLDGRISANGHFIPAIKSVTMEISKIRDESNEILS